MLDPRTCQRIRSWQYQTGGGEFGGVRTRMMSPWLYHVRSFSRLGLRKGRSGRSTPQKRGLQYRAAQLDGFEHHLDPDSRHVSERLRIDARGMRSSQKDRERLFPCSTSSGNARLAVPELRGDGRWSFLGMLGLPGSPGGRRKPLGYPEIRFVPKCLDPLAVWTG